ncbi:hypothetical protein [Candidatus Hepatobacter penaei]|uniref:hypothetical protein n=1 Tax=Candidatus Hepatobacter penaei TaxID=1274402 RepID=UPI0004F26E5F|nr:hypothetical protein [Candidatus Hepatobacter penaei]
MLAIPCILPPPLKGACAVQTDPIEKLDILAFLFYLDIKYHFFITSLSCSLGLFMMRFLSSSVFSVFLGVATLAAPLLAPPSDPCPPDVSEALAGEKGAPMAPASSTVSDAPTHATAENTALPTSKASADAAGNASDNADAEDSFSRLPNEMIDLIFERMRGTLLEKEQAAKALSRTSRRLHEWSKGSRYAFLSSRLSRPLTCHEANTRAAALTDPALSLKMDYQNLGGNPSIQQCVQDIPEYVTQKTVRLEYRHVYDLDMRWQERWPALTTLIIHEGSKGDSHKYACLPVREDPETGQVTSLTPHLKVLHVLHPLISSKNFDNIKHLSCMKSLVELSLKNQSITPNFVDALSKLKALRTLHLENAFAPIQSKESLVQCWLAFAKLPLTKLSLTHMTFLNDDVTASEAFACLFTMTRLESLTLHGPNAHVHGGEEISPLSLSLSALKGMKALHTLGLGHLDLQDPKKLGSLHQDTQITDLSLNCVGGVQSSHLKGLKLTRLALTDSVVRTAQWLQEGALSYNGISKDLTTLKDTSIKELVLSHMCCVSTPCPSNLKKLSIVEGYVSCGDDTWKQANLTHLTWEGAEELSNIGKAYGGLMSMLRKMTNLEMLKVNTVKAGTSNGFIYCDLQSHHHLRYLHLNFRWDIDRDHPFDHLQHLHVWIKENNIHDHGYGDDILLEHLLSLTPTLQALHIVYDSHRLGVEHILPAIKEHPLGFLTTVTIACEGLDMYRVPRLESEMNFEPEELLFPNAPLLALINVNGLIRDEF